MSRVNRMFHKLRTLGAEQYRNPTPSELLAIEWQLKGEGLPCTDYVVNRFAFEEFRTLIKFPADYHGGRKGGVYEEKLLEHYVAWELLGLCTPGKRYLDIAGASSPWARLLRSTGTAAFSVDLTIPKQFSELDYYLRQDATATSFPNNYFDAASTQCAYELFVGPSDMRLLTELSRILKPGGRVVISPLYMHTHACFYQTPEYYGRTQGDLDAKGYLRRDSWGVPASRKYSARSLKQRVFETARRAGLTPHILVLRNKKDISENVYLHFILVLEKQTQ